MWMCARCGEKNPDTFDVCWRCTGERIQGDEPADTPEATSFAVPWPAGAPVAPPPAGPETAKPITTTGWRFVAAVRGGLAGGALAACAAVLVCRASGVRLEAAPGFGVFLAGGLLASSVCYRYPSLASGWSKLH
jgi:hypothetical protein